MQSALNIRILEIFEVLALYAESGAFSLEGCNNRVASGPGNLEKSGNFVALEKCQEKSGNFVKIGKVREFSCKIGKSQGILLAQNEYRISFFKIHSSGEQELVKPVHESCMLMDFYLRLKKNLIFFFSFWIRKCTVTD